MENGPRLCVISYIPTITVFRHVTPCSLIDGYKTTHSVTEFFIFTAVRTTDLYMFYVLELEFYDNSR
jgi:hypothetical protein